MSGAVAVGRPKKGTPKAPPAADARQTLINLKGTAEQAAWFDAIHKKTHIPKTVIVRLALNQWALANGHPEFPEGDE